MKRSIEVLSLDDAWNKMEHKVIDLLCKFNSLENINKDTKYLIGKYLLTFVLQSITTCSIEFENTTEGLITYISSKKYPFKIFYLDESKITNNKEILEYMDMKTFLVMLKSIIKDINIASNNRIILCDFPYTNIKNISFDEYTNTPNELYLKTEIMKQHKLKRRSTIETVFKVCHKYSVKLDELKIRKIIS